MQPRYHEAVEIAPAVNTADAPLEPISFLDLAITAVIAIGIFLLFRLFISQGLDLHHDGVMLKTALDVASGQVLFRDTFSQYGVMTAWLQAAFLRWTVADLYHLKLLTVLAYSGAYALLYLGSRFYLPRIISSACVLVAIPFAYFFNIVWTMHPWSSSLALFFQCGALLFFLWGRKSNSCLLVFVAGIWAGLCFGCRHPVGVLLFLALSASFLIPHQKMDLRLRLRRIFPLFAGFVAVLLTYALILWKQGALSDWWLQSVVWPRRWAALNSAGVRVLWNLVGNRSIGIVAFPALFLAVFIRQSRWPIAALLFMMVLFHKNFLRIPDGGWTAILPLTLVLGFVRLRSFPPALGIAILAGLASWPQDIPVACERHTFWANLPMIPAAAGVVWNVLRSRATADRPALSARKFAFIVILLFIPAMVDKIRLGRENLREPLVSLDAIPTLRGIRASDIQADALLSTRLAFEKFWRRIGEKTPVFLLAEDAIYSVLSPDGRNYVPVFVRWYGSQGPRAEYGEPTRARIEQVAMRDRPAIVFQGSEVEMREFARCFQYGVVRNFPWVRTWVLLPAGRRWEDLRAKHTWPCRESAFLF